MPVDDLAVEAPADTGADEALEPAGDDLGTETASEDNSGLEIADGADETPSAEGEEKPDPNAADLSRQQDGRALPDDIKKSLKALQAINPTAAGKMRDGLFELQARREVFPTAADAVKAKEFIETVGGEDGFKGLQESMEQWSGLSAAYAEGSPEFVKHLSQENPEAFAKMVPSALNEWAQSHSEAYGYFSNSVALNTMAQAGLSTQNLQSLLNHAGLADNPQARQIVQDLLGIVGGLQGKAQQFQQVQSQRNPEKEKFEQQKQQWEQDRQDDFEKGVNGQADGYVVEKSQPLIDQYLGSQKVTDDMRALIAEKVKAEVGDRLAKIGGFDQQIQRLYQARDGDRVVPYIQRNVDRVLQPAVKAVVEKLYRNVTPPKPVARIAQPAQQNGQQAPVRSTGTIELKSAPDWSKVDRSKTPDTDFLMGKAVLKDGRRVTWQ